MANTIKCVRNKDGRIFMFTEKLASRSDMEVVNVDPTTGREAVAAAKPKPAPKPEPKPEPAKKKPAKKKD